MFHKKFAFVMVLSVFLYGAFSILIPAKDQSAEGNDKSRTVNLPEWSGKYIPGRDFFYLTTPPGNGSSGEGNNGRTLAIWLYYPSANYSTANHPSASSRQGNEILLPDEIWREKHRESIGKRYGEKASLILSGFSTYALWKAVPLKDNGKFPLLIFAPGYSWLPVDYSVLIEELVSRGFVVAAFASPGLSSVIRMPSVTFISLAGFSEESYSTLAEDFLRVKKMIGSLNNDTAWSLSGLVDTDRTGLLGHSIGGAAAVMAASKDSSIKAVCNLDGDYSGKFEVHPPQPLLYITSQPFNLNGIPPEKWDEDRSEGRRERVWESVKTRSVMPVRIRITGMYHSNFQDAAILPKELFPSEVLEKRLGKIDGLYGLRITSDLLGSFFTENLISPGIKQLLQRAEKYPELIIEKPGANSADVRIE